MDTEYDDLKKFIIIVADYVRILDEAQCSNKSYLLNALEDTDEFNDIVNCAYRGIHHELYYALEYKKQLENFNSDNQDERETLQEDYWESKRDTYFGLVNALRLDFNDHCFEDVIENKFYELYGL